VTSRLQYGCSIRLADIVSSLRVVDLAINVGVG
jgi:hypothetical protein